MPTTISRTIGSGGYYATIADWNADAPANLVTADQVWEGRLLNQLHTASTTVANISGSTSDATRFKRLICDAGASFRDHANKLTNALLPNAANGALITQTGTNDANPTLVVSEDYAEIIGLQISSTDGPSDGLASPPALVLAGPTIKAQWCLVESFSGYCTVYIGGCVPKHCTFIKRRHSGNVVRPTTVVNIGLDNCTLVVPSDVNLTGGYSKPAAIQRNYNITTLRNPAIFGCATLTGSGVGTINTTNGVADFTASGFTQVAFDTGSGAGFQNTTNDFRVKSSSAMVGAGANYAGILTEDIIGQTVAATPSAGAWEAGAGGGDTTLPTLTGSITVSALATTGYTLTWPAGADNVAVTGYEVSLDGGTSYASVGNVLTTNITGRTPGSTDAVRVRAFDAANNKSTPALSTSVTLSSVTGTCTITNIKNNAGTLQTAVTIDNLIFIKRSDRTLVLALTSQVTNGSGNLPITHVNLVTGTNYIALGFDNAGTNSFRQFVTAT
jgi:hypothetical protein